jgi:orotidine-5'-phosphate decarboxylase
MRTSSFQERLHAAARTNESWLSVGLDPEPSRLPAGLSVDAFLRGIVEATRDLVCCFKPNLAFFEASGVAGLQTLVGLLRWLPRDIPVLVDAKRGDTPQTMQAYARAIFEELGADAVTVNSYFGRDSLEPFLKYADRGVFVLCKTSNPGAVEIQDLAVGGEPLFLRVARLAMDWNTNRNVGLVVGATYPEDVARVREIAPSAPILLPGIGAQAGDLERSVRAGITPDGSGAIVNASRSVLYASRDADWQTAARSEATRLRAAINAARAESATALR